MNNDIFMIDFTPNGSDHFSRYSVKEQKGIIKWNLEKLAEALFPLISKEDSSQILDTFETIYKTERYQHMKKKFGLLTHLEGNFNNIYIF